MVLACPAQALEIRLGIPFPEKSKQFKEAAKALQKAAATKRKTKLVLSSYDASKDGVVAKVSGGALDGALVVGKDLATLGPDALAYALPFTFSSPQQVESVRSEMDATILKKLSAGPYEALGFSEFGLAYLFSGQPIASPQSLLARKIWVPTGGEIGKSLEGLGLKTVPLSLKEVNGAVKSGTVDTVIATFEMVIYKRWHRRIKKMKVLDCPFAYNYGIWIMRDKAFKDLTPEDRNAVRSCVKSVGQKLEGLSRSNNSSTRKILKQNFKTEFVIPDEALKKQWREWAEKIWQHLGKEHRPTSEVERKLKSCLRAYGKKEREDPAKPERN
jgi:TRAP-type C4-dicarboxylate transport system substrate-binding protein